MSITSVTAAKEGKFLVEYDNGSESLVDPLSEDSASSELALWFRAGNQADPYVEPVYVPTDEEIQEERRQGVEAERDRRIALGTEVMLTGHATPVFVQGGPAHEANITGVKLVADEFVDQGITSTIRFRDGHNVIHDLTGAQIKEMFLLGGLHKSAIYDFSWALKDTPGGIPADYTDDSYWTASTP